MKAHDCRLPHPVFVWRFWTCRHCGTTWDLRRIRQQTEHGVATVVATPPKGKKR